MNEFQKYLDYVDAYGRKYPEQRSGQVYFNSLHLYDFELANAIRSTHLDPFYNDYVITNFLEYVEKHYSENT